MSSQAEIIKPREGDETDDVLFNSLYGVLSVELNRPKKLNSLNHSMARKILPVLKVGDTLLIYNRRVCMYRNMLSAG